VKATIRTTRVVATADLPPGQIIPAAALSMEERDEAPSTEPFAQGLDQVEGKLPRRTIRAGTPIRSDWLAAANAVERGETVQVEVREGGALLQFSGEARRAGAVGQTIPVMNPMSKTVFRGRIEGKGKVAVGGEK
jgi:flagella basal body P-ring formation protein FlgA